MRYEQREWAPHQDRGPLHIVRPDGLNERLTRRHEPISGVFLWIIVCVIALCSFGLGVVHGRVSPVQPVAVAELRHDY